MKKTLLLSILFFSFLFYGCVSSKFTYTPPKEIKRIENTIVVNSSKDAVWKKLIQGIGTNFFVINNMDKESGFINISYSGDPEKFVEGGELHHYFSNARGERNYIFPGSRAYTQYETMIDGSLCVLTRKLDLDGRMNVLVSEIDSLQTSVTVNTKYIITMNVSGQDVLGKPLIPHNEVISFNTGQSAKNAGGTEFYSNGEFEEAILKLVR